MLAVRRSAHLDAISVGNFAAQALGTTLPAILFGALATALGAATEWSRGIVFGITAGTGVLTYAMHGFAPQIGAYGLRYLTPYHYYLDGHPLTNGLGLLHTAVLVAATATLAAVGAWQLRDRDLGRCSGHGRAAAWLIAPSPPAVAEGGSNDAR